MVTPVAWSGSVNQVVLMEGASEAYEDSIREYSPQVGPPIRERRTSMEATLHSFWQLLTFTEWDTFNTWYETSLKNGSIPFTRGHPRKGVGVQITAFFTERPQSGMPVSATKYKIQFKIRTIP